MPRVAGETRDFQRYWRNVEGGRQDARGYRDAGASSTSRPIQVDSDRYHSRLNKRTSKRKGYR